MEGRTGRPEKVYVNTTKYIKISSVPMELRETLNNIAANMNEDLSKVLRQVLKAYVDSQPEHMKRKPLDY